MEESYDKVIYKYETRDHILLYLLFNFLAFILTIKTSNVIFVLVFLIYSIISFYYGRGALYIRENSFEIIYFSFFKKINVIYKYSEISSIKGAIPISGVLGGILVQQKDDKMFYRISGLNTSTYIQMKEIFERIGVEFSFGEYKLK